MNYMSGRKQAVASIRKKNTNSACLLENYLTRNKLHSEWECLLAFDECLELVHSHNLEQFVLTSLRAIAGAKRINFLAVKNLCSSVVSLGGAEW